MKVAIVFGTRPEAIKLAPVILEMRRSGQLFPLVVNTGQHRDLSKQALACFDIIADINLDVMAHSQSLGQLTGRLFGRVSDLLDRERPAWVLVQGDTTSAMVAATCAYYSRVPIGHVEAGLRTFEIGTPFPEEMNRTFIGQVANMHFAPTESARINLERASVQQDRILVTGNTAVDAVHLLRPSIASRSLTPVLGKAAARQMDGKRIILVTCHRRESFGSGVEGVCTAVRRLIEEFADLAVVIPVHPNPNVYETVHKMLGGVPRVHLAEPMTYIDLMTVIERATFILSDSGGLQEEAPSFGKPILILRNVTERPEVVDVGAGILVGTDPEVIVPAARALLTDPAVYARMASARNPFGDGWAARRIVEALNRMRA